MGWWSVADSGCVHAVGSGGAALSTHAGCGEQRGPRQLPCTVLHARCLPVRPSAHAVSQYSARLTLLLGARMPTAYVLQQQRAAGVGPAARDASVQMKQLKQLKLGRGWVPHPAQLQPCPRCCPAAAFPAVPVGQLARVHSQVVVAGGAGGHDCRAAGQRRGGHPRRACRFFFLFFATAAGRQQRSSEKRTPLKPPAA